MDKEFFNKGETAEQFISNMGNNREKFKQLMGECELSQEQIDRLATLPSNLNVMVIAEDWSGDVLYFLPVLICIARESSWDVRIFHRDQHPDLILPYRKDGLYHSIPVFVFYDQEFNEVTTWIERPVAASQIIDQESLNLRRELREQYKIEWRQETVNEILGLTTNIKVKSK